MIEDPTMHPPMSQDEIRAWLATDPAVQVTVAAEGDGSPPIAWGDTFVYACDAAGAPRKMPFVTIVIKDYPGFDEDSRLDRGGLFRLNLDLGKERFTAQFGFAPKDLDAHRAAWDFAAVDVLFPHPTYGSHGWASILNPSAASRARALELLGFVRDRALGRTR